MRILNGIKKVIDAIMRIVGTITLSVMTVLVWYQVIARYFFNSPSSITEALSQFLFVWLIMFGSAYVYGSKEHLTIDILKDKMSARLNMIVEIITNVFLFVFIAVVCVYGGFIYSKGQVVQTDPSLHISKAIIYSSLPFTGAMTLFYAVYNCAKAVADYKAGKRSFGDELSGTA